MNTASITNASAGSLTSLANNNLLVFLARNIEGIAGGVRMSLYDYVMGCSANICRALLGTGESKSIRFFDNQVTVSVIDPALKSFTMDKLSRGLKEELTTMLSSPDVQLATIVKSLVLHNLALNNVFSNIGSVIDYMVYVRVENISSTTSCPLFMISEIKLTFGFKDTYPLISQNSGSGAVVF